MGMFDSMKLTGGLGSSSTSSSGTKTSRLDITQEGIDKLIYDILSSDQGLASLASGENLSGGFGSTAKAQLAQDMTIKLAGELAKLTAETVETSNVSEKSKSKKVGTVICTELNRQGLLPDSLYNAGHIHFLGLPDETVAGYQLWASKLVPILAVSPRLSAAIAPIAISRYQMTTGLKRFTFWGALTIYLGQPICYLIGKIFLTKEQINGDLGRAS